MQSYEANPSLPRPTPRIYWLLASIVALEVLDALTTYFLLHSGRGTEGNPILGVLPGDAKFTAVKAIAGVLCSLLLYDVYKRHPRIGLISTSLVTFGLLLIVLWNVTAYFIGSAY